MLDSVCAVRNRIPVGRGMTTTCISPVCARLRAGGPLCPVQKKEKKPGYHFDSYIFSLDRLFGSQLANGIGAFPVTKQDIEEHFSSHGSGKIMEIKLMSGFGFIEYEDGMDARDVVPGKLLRY